MKMIILGLAALIMLGFLPGCTAKPVLVVPEGVAYVEPYYPCPDPGYNWRYDTTYGWGWHHPKFGWHHPEDVHRHDNISEKIR